MLTTLHLFHSFNFYPYTNSLPVCVSSIFFKCIKHYAPCMVQWVERLTRIWSVVRSVDPHQRLRLFASANS